MKTKVFVVLVATAMAIAFSVTSFAASSKTISVTASVPTQAGGLSVIVSKILPSPTGGADSWVESGSSLPINFGTLNFDNTNHIFRATYYYAVDIGVDDNTGTAWTITHTRNSIKKDTVNNLDNNVNVSFVKQLTKTTDSPLQKVSFANSNNVAYGKATLSGGWLRIYYGIATGNADTDTSGVLPIGTDKPAGTYSGSVVITLTP